MYVNNNAAALNAWFNLNNTTTSMQNTLAQLSSGYKINTAADNPAGLAIAQNMLAQANGLSQGSQNAQNGVSLLQTGDGALNQIQNILQSMYQLASQGASGTLNATDTAALQAEMNQYAQEITQITNNTTFNNVNLLSGKELNNTQIQIGANSGQTLGISISPVDAATLGVTGNKGTVTGPNVHTAFTNGATATVGTASTAYTIGNSLSASSTYSVTASYTGWGAKAFTSGGNITGASFVATSQYTGSLSHTYAVKIQTGTAGGGPTGKTVTNASVSVDGGTYQKVSFATSGSTNASITLPNTGTKVKLTLTAASNATDSNSITLTPANTKFALRNGSGASGAIQASTTLNGAQSSATVNLAKGSNSYFNDTAANVTADTLTAAKALGASSISTATGVNWYKLAVSAGGTAATTVNTTTGVANASASRGLDITNQTDAEAALTKIINAINQVSTTRGNVGALMNRLQFAYNDNQITSQNMTNARAGIMDADMAMEMATLSQQQVLQQSGVAMLAQANALPQALLRLLT
jgi:flagellin